MAKKRAAKGLKSASISGGKMTLRGPKGAKVDIHLASLKVSAKQKMALRKLLKTGDLGSLSSSEANSIKNVKYRLPRLPGVSMGPIVRFDWKWVRID